MTKQQQIADLTTRLKAAVKANESWRKSIESVRAEANREIAELHDALTQIGRTLAVRSESKIMYGDASEALAIIGMMQSRIEEKRLQLEESRATVESLLEAIALQNGHTLPRWRKNDHE